jgi:hypothetical protein
LCEALTFTDGAVRIGFTSDDQRGTAGDLHLRGHLFHHRRQAPLQVVQGLDPGRPVEFLVQLVMKEDAPAKGLRVDALEGLGLVPSGP